ncbi:related to integral membrane protein PTH11 [Phialocephala subalpina]|uniref:Related to integral membrane protein PTH11 n=1 Tax=Phialocephala subalpina TaxID=576137 RepID=A0A1L7X6I5_9HELO|nr:related to integral membrane protein PTH11 [Phialocephala subalpina]
MSLGLGQVISWWICTFFALIFLGARLFVKFRKFGTLSIDDGFLILAALCLVGDLAIQQYMWNEGNLRDDDLYDPADRFKMIVPGSILYVTSLWAIKVALVIFYKRIASRTTLQTVYNMVLGALGVTWAVIFFDIIFQCYPIDRKWTTDSNRTCSTEASDINYWLTILLNIFSDIVIITLPITMVMKLKMPLKQKLGVAAMFALGFFVVIASIIRAYYSRINNTMLTCTVSMVETAISIIATCLPVLRTIILGHTSRTGTASRSNGRHYELSSHHARVTTGRGTQVKSTYVVGGTRKASDSEDELVKETAAMSGPSSVASGVEEGKQTGIAVTTEFQVFAEDGDSGRRNIVKF